MIDTNDKNAEVEMDSENNNKSENQQEKIREIRLNPEALSDLPTELFLRLVGLFNTIPADHLKDLKYLDNATKFQELKVFIETELASEDGKNFAKSELHLCSVTVLMYFPALGSTAQKTLTEPLRLYS